MGAIYALLFALTSTFSKIYEIIILSLLSLKIDKEIIKKM